ncbi:MAG: sigma factor, partial [Jatrophihabitantaceae bacterium]
MADQTPFDEFVRRRSPELVRLCWALTGDLHKGEDLAQATLGRIWPRWERISQSGEPWSYTQQVAIRLAATWRRRRWVYEVPHSDDWLASTTYD